MARNSLQSLHHQYQCHQYTISSSRHRRHSLDSSAPSFLSSSAFSSKPTSKQTSSRKTHNIIFSLFSSSSRSQKKVQATTTTSQQSPTGTTNSTVNITFEALEKHLANKNFKEADEVTRRLLIVLAGEAAQKRGYVFFSEVQFISEADLKTIDKLWRKYSDNKYGYSVQKRIWEKVNKDFTKFFLKAGWMKKLDTEIEQFNYKAFPNDFFWELTNDTPEGHLPLTNALRGTQLLNCILSHPAFQNMEEEEDGQEKKLLGDNTEDNTPKGRDSGGSGTSAGTSSSNSKPPTLSKGLFKPDYSF